jgi:hypothetical protein
LVASTSTVFTVALQALSGGGTAMEQVEVRLHLETNLGVPGAIAGTFTNCSGATQAYAVGCTSAQNGTATFEISIPKAGGYVLCATASLDGFTFDKACSARFHVRN